MADAPIDVRRFAVEILENAHRALGRAVDGLTDEQSIAVEKMTLSLVRRILADPISFLRSEEDSAAEAVQKVFALGNSDEKEEDEAE